MKLYKLPVDLKEDKDLDAFYKTNSNKIMDVNLFYREIEKNKESFFGISEIYAYMSMAWKAAREHYEKRWISVDDELPIEGEIVLAGDRLSYGTYSLERNGSDSQLLWSDHYGNIDPDSDGELCNGSWITHWMPLPKPPID